MLIQPSFCSVPSAQEERVQKQFATIFKSSGSNFWRSKDRREFQMDGMTVRLQILVLTFRLWRRMSLPLLPSRWRPLTMRCRYPGRRWQRWNRSRCQQSCRHTRPGWQPLYWRKCLQKAKTTKVGVYWQKMTLCARSENIFQGSFSWFSLYPTKNSGCIHNSFITFVIT